MDPNPKLHIPLGVAFLLITIPLYIYSSQTIFTAASASMGFTSILYGALSGVKEARVNYKYIKASGGVAVFLILGWFFNSELEKRNPIVDPVPGSWIALDRNGEAISVTIGGETYVLDSAEFLRDAVWHVEEASGLIRTRKGENALASINLASLEHLGLFDQIDMSLGKGMQYTNNLTAGSVADLSPVYPLKIQATQFKNEYNGFKVLDKNNVTVIDQGLLRTRNFQSFKYNGAHYLIFVLGANHMDTDKAPWASFGITQIDPVLRLPK